MRDRQEIIMSDYHKYLKELSDLEDVIYDHCYMDVDGKIINAAPKEYDYKAREMYIDILNVLAKHGKIFELELETFSKNRKKRATKK